MRLVSFAQSGAALAAHCNVRTIREDEGIPHHIIDLVHVDEEAAVHTQETRIREQLLGFGHRHARTQRLASLRAMHDEVMPVALDVRDVLERHGDRLALDAQPGMRRRPLQALPRPSHALRHIRGADGLHAVVQRAHGKAFHRILRPARHEEDDARRSQLTHDTGHIDAIHVPLQHDIEKDDLGGLGAECLQERGGIGLGTHAEHFLMLLRHPMLDHQRESFPCLLIVIQYHQSQTARLFPIASNLSGCFSICHGGYFLCTTGTYFYFY